MDELSNKIIGQIIAFVDGEHLPAALPNERTWSLGVALDEAGIGVEVSAIFKTNEGSAARATLSKIHHEIQDPKSRWRIRGTLETRRKLANELDSAIVTAGMEQESMLVAIGFAAGLRAGGASRLTTRAMLRALLRNYQNKER